MMSRLDAVAARMNPWLLLVAIGLAATDLSVAAFRFAAPLPVLLDSGVVGEALRLPQ
jgi:hypothetical protein